MKKTQVQHFEWAGRSKVSWPIEVDLNHLDAASASHVHQNMTKQPGGSIARHPSHLDRVSPSACRHLSLSLPLDLSPLVRRASSTRNVFLLRPPPFSTYPRVTGPQAGAARLEGHGIAERVGCDFGSLRRHERRNRRGARGSMHSN